MGPSITFLLPPRQEIFPKKFFLQQTQIPLPYGSMVIDHTVLAGLIAGTFALLVAMSWISLSLMWRIDAKSRDYLAEIIRLTTRHSQEIMERMDRRHERGRKDMQVLLRMILERTDRSDKG